MSEILNYLTGIWYIVYDNLSLNDKKIIIIITNLHLIIQGYDMDTERRKIFCRTMAVKLPSLRKISGLTQAEFADISGLSRQTVSNIESGRINLKWNTCLAFAFIFQAHPDTRAYMKAQGWEEVLRNELVYKYYTKVSLGD